VTKQLDEGIADTFVLATANDGPGGLRVRKTGGLADTDARIKRKDS